MMKVFPRFVRPIKIELDVNQSEFWKKHFLFYELRGDNEVINFVKAKTFKGLTAKKF